MRIPGFSFRFVGRHVAAALELGVREFLTFDERQRREAKADGLLVHP
jgi:hypothetical protein